MIEMISVMTIISALAAIVIPKLQENIDRARAGKAIGDIRAIQVDIEGWSSTRDNVPPPSLAEIGRPGAEDPWGNPYVYVPFDPSDGPSGRTDRFGVYLNSTYDLYSVGKDGASASSLGAGSSQDDIVRAADGGFIGLGKTY
jgi:general secretion pathway protein G